jgi:hypothetical protein
MSWRQFFDVLGLPIDELRKAWPQELRPEDQLARARKNFHRIYDALVRRRRAIESLRHEIQKDEMRSRRHFDNELDLRIACNRRRLHQREANYQRLLARMARSKRRLARLMNESRSALVA